MDEPSMLDLYCGAGGASDGYARAGFRVEGVDIKPQPNYPYPFHLADVLSLSPEWLSSFDVIHASPPCQRYSVLRHRYTENVHPDLIGPTRALLEKADRPYIIENVEDAREELFNPVMLCGLMFPPLRVFRHRLFEIRHFELPKKGHPPHTGILCHTMDKRKRHYGMTDEWEDFVQVTGGGNSSRDAAANAMGLDHRYLTKTELNEAIPPAYTYYIGEHLIRSMEE